MADETPPQSEIILYQTEDGRTRIQCRLENETIWLTQKLMADLFQKDVRTINEHIQNVLAEEELSPDSVIRNFRITAADGKSYDTQHYRLEMILAVGYPITLGRLEGHGKRGKPLIADYVLIHHNTKLAVVEAKAWDAELTEGVAQAKDYAGKLAIRFTYSTNGQGIYGIDMREGTEGEQPRYPTPGELWSQTFTEQNAWRDRFAAVPFEDRGGYFQGRYYQDIAIERVLEVLPATEFGVVEMGFMRQIEGQGDGGFVLPGRTGPV